MSELFAVPEIGFPLYESRFMLEEEECDRLEEHLESPYLSWTGHDSFHFRLQA